MTLDSLLRNELAKLRAMEPEALRALPEFSSREVEKTWRTRRSLSIYAERCEEGMLRVIVKTFESQFPHIAIQGQADGFRLAPDGQIKPLTREDETTLY